MTDAHESLDESILDDNDEVATYPASADPKEIYSYKNAAVILSEVQQTEIAAFCAGLRAFTVDTAAPRKAGGNESHIPKEFDKALRPSAARDNHLRRLARQPALEGTSRRHAQGQNEVRETGPKDPTRALP
jgi:hypothetical protein